MRDPLELRSTACDKERERSRCEAGKRDTRAGDLVLMLLFVKIYCFESRRVHGARRELDRKQIKPSRLCACVRKRGTGSPRTRGKFTVPYLQWLPDLISLINTVRIFTLFHAKKKTETFPFLCVLARHNFSTFHSLTASSCSLQYVIQCRLFDLGPQVSLLLSIRVTTTIITTNVKIEHHRSQ